MLDHLSKLQDAETCLITAENVYGEKGKGGMAKQTTEPQPEIIRIGQCWDGPQSAARDLGEKYKIRPCIRVPKGETAVLMDFDGPAVITHFWLTLDEGFLRDLILRIYWDGEDSPSVEAPVGDFFGCVFCCGYSIMSIPLNVNPTRGMNCYFPMPFRKHAHITVENRNPDNDLTALYYAISCEKRAVLPDEVYFHAKFNRANPLESGEDYVILDGVRGRGHYVGTVLGWQQNSNGWWGEGEVKGFIDGDTEYPTYIGTGTEDYFGGAWGFGDDYSAPFLGYRNLSLLKDPSIQLGRVGNRHAMYRFHIADPIRFREDFRLTIQALGWRSAWRYLPLKDDICSVAYWYQTEPHAVFAPLLSRDDLECI